MATTPLYQHRQVGRLTLLVLAAVWVLTVVMLSQAPPGRGSGSPWQWAPAVMPVLIALVFGSLQVSVDADALRWRFGWLGLPRWQLALDDIERVEIVRSRWTEGWGVQWTRRGMLYNTSGLDALRVVRRNGKVLRIGSDDVHALAAQVQALLAERAHAGRGRQLPSAGRRR
jgi:hypothetical protein